MLKILGIDPGSRVVGLALLEIKKGKAHYKSSHILKLKKNKISSKLSFLLEEFEVYLKKIKPDVVIIEDNFYHKNPKVLLTLGRVSGVLIALSSKFGLPVFLYSPTDIKKNITGFGQASKEQVAYMVKEILKLKGNASVDATDAISIALCYYYKNNSFKKIKEEK